MDFQKLFKPETIAVIGVSFSNDLHPANVIYNKNRLRYPVNVFPVNPRGGVIDDEKVFSSVGDIPEKVDLAVIAVRAESCPDTLLDCVRAGVGGAVIISGGFAETGRDDLQKRLVDIAEKSDFPFIGPNCLGIYSPSSFDSFFLPSERMVRPETGNVSIVSQSGGVLVDQMVKFTNEGVGLALAVSIGNKAVIGEIELLEYLTHDPETEVITFYIEGFEKNEGRNFVLAARDCPKPVIVFKAGKSDVGMRAVSSHTASLAGDYDTFSAVLAQHGVIEARDEFEMVSFCESLSCYSQTIKGQIGIVTGSGGHGALAVDICSDHDLPVPSITEETQDKIRKVLAPSIQKIASLGNPIDLTGSASDDDFVAAVRGMSLLPQIDCVIILLLPYLPGITSDLGAKLSQIYRQIKKPLIAYVPHVEKYRMLIEGFELNRIPVSHSIEGAVHMTKAMRRVEPC